MVRRLVEVLPDVLTMRCQQSLAQETPRKSTICNIDIRRNTSSALTPVVLTSSILRKSLMESARSLLHGRLTAIPAQCTHPTRLPYF